MRSPYKCDNIKFYGRSDLGVKPSLILYTTLEKPNPNVNLLRVNIHYPATVPVGYVNRLVRLRRVRGGVGTGGEKPPVTHLGGMLPVISCATGLRSLPLYVD